MPGEHELLAHEALERGCLSKTTQSLKHAKRIL
jgi:hypothetical protein